MSIKLVTKLRRDLITPICEDLCYVLGYKIINNEEEDNSEHIFDRGGAHLYKTGLTIALIVIIFHLITQNVKHIFANRLNKVPHLT